MHVKEVPELVGACCVLHNICQQHGEGFNEQWLETQSTVYFPTFGPMHASNTDGDRVRASFTQYFEHQ